MSDGVVGEVDRIVLILIHIESTICPAHSTHSIRSDGSIVLLWIIHVVARVHTFATPRFSIAGILCPVLYDHCGETEVMDQTLFRGEPDRGETHPEDLVDDP